MTWRVGLKGDSSDLERLREHLAEGPLRVVRDGDEHAVEMDEFANLQLPRDMFDRAKQIMPALNGCLRLYAQSKVPLTLTHVFGYEDGVKRHIVAIVEPGLLTISVYPPCANATGTDENGQIIPPRFPMRALVALALRDATVEKVLRLTTQESEPWVSLYRILEVIEGDAGSLEAIRDKGWATLAELKRFNHTANSPAVLGDEARHGHATTQPPANPTTLKEARELVGRVTVCWIRAKEPSAI